MFGLLSVPVRDPVPEVSQSQLAPSDVTLKTIQFPGCSSLSIFNSHPTRTPPSLTHLKSRTRSIKTFQSSVSSGRYSKISVSVIFTNRSLMLPQKYRSGHQD
eukprot:1195158-Prorocentrum_minimum.AAC.3